MADKKSQRFTIDSEREGAEVPTLTQLLYKKNVVKSQGSPGSGRQSRGLDAGASREQDHSRIMTLEPTVTVERPSPTAPKIEPVAPAPEFVVSQIGSNRPNPLNMGAAPATPGGHHVMPAATPFASTASVRPTPVAAYPKKAVAADGIRLLAEKAKVEASLVFEEAGGAFVLKSIVAGSPERAALWNGMEIAKDTFSDLLGRLAKFGFAEFSTLGAAGSGNFDRATFRIAFGAKGSEWLTLVKVKSATGGDAIVAFLTAGSIQVHLPAFHSAGMPAAKAA